jgi:hypothetical protein
MLPRQSGIEPARDVSWSRLEGQFSSDGIGSLGLQDMPAEGHG